MSYKYRFTKCLNPKKVYNPYTTEPLIAPCGECEACLLTKAFVRTQKCKLESLSHKYCLFVTLTYSESNIPRMYLRRYSDSGKLYDCTPRLSKYDNEYMSFLGDTFLTDCQYNELQQKVENSNLPYLHKPDLQRFLKRLRKQLSKYSNEKIRYFAVGEYGPVHFRPHFHLLLWMSEEETLSRCREIIPTVWRFGSVCSEVAKGDCASYTSGYLNGFSALPKVFKINRLKPFCTHSSYLGETILKKVRTNAYELSYEDFMVSRLPFNGHTKDVPLWRSLISYYFPKCRNYAFESKRGRLYAYTCFATAYQWTQEISPYRASKYIVQYIYENWLNGDNLNRPTHYVDEYDRLLEFFFSNYRFSTKKVCRCDKDVFEQMFNSIYNDLRLSKHFLQSVCNTRNRVFPTQQEINYKYTLIEKFYIKKDYENLKNQMSDQITWFDTECYELDDVIDYSDNVVPMFYDNTSATISSLQECSQYKIMKEITSKMALEQIKHKELNDRNRKFINYG